MRVEAASEDEGKLPTRSGYMDREMDVNKRLEASKTMGKGMIMMITTTMIRTWN